MPVADDGRRWPGQDGQAVQAALGAGLACPALVLAQLRGLEEAVQLGLGFALGGLHHQRARHREAHGRRVETVVRQPLRNVVDGHPGGDRVRAAVDAHAALLGDQTLERVAIGQRAGARHRLDV